MKNEISLLTTQFNETRENLEKKNQELQTKCSLLENETLPQVTEALSQKKSENEEFLKKIEQFAPVLAPAIGALVAFKVALGISSVIEGLVGALKTLKAANEGARISQLLLNAAMGANPIVLIISLIVAAISALVIL